MRFFKIQDHFFWFSICRTKCVDCTLIPLDQNGKLLSFDCHSSPSSPLLSFLFHLTNLSIILFPFIQSEIEEALVRIKELEGVEGYVICNNDGTVLRHQVDMSKKMAEDLARVSLFLEDTLQHLSTTYYSSPFAHHRHPSFPRPPTSNYTMHSTESNQACHTSHQRYTRSRSKWRSQDLAYQDRTEGDHCIAWKGFHCGCVAGVEAQIWRRMNKSKRWMKMRWFLIDIVCIYRSRLLITTASYLF